ncbi:glutamate synthase subunit beta domain protein, partial [Vibrio parahaemolyticus V-223/04]
MLNWIS